MATAGAKTNIDMLKFFNSMKINIFEGFMSTEGVFMTINTPDNIN